MPHFEGFCFHLYKPMTVFKLVQVNHFFKRLWIHDPSFHSPTSQTKAWKQTCSHGAQLKSSKFSFLVVFLLKGTRADSVIRLLSMLFRSQSAGVVSRGAGRWEEARWWIDLNKICTSLVTFHWLHIPWTRNRDCGGALCLSLNSG